MSEWISVEQWHRCAELQRPGYVIEIRNLHGQRMFTRCMAAVPQPPFDWKSPPKEFRAIVEEAPRHSDPIPRALRP